MACFLLLVLQAHGLSVADDTATSTLEERYLVFEHDSLGELVESGTAPKKTFQNCLHVGKNIKTQQSVFFDHHFHLELQIGRAFPLAATKWRDTDIVAPCSL